jgi:hypothetical protein
MDTITSQRTEAITVPTLVRRALQRCGMQFTHAQDMPHLTHADKVTRSERLAVLCDRESRWYGVLHRWAYSPQGTVPLVFAHAAVRAESCAMSDARFWANDAAYYRARLAGFDHDQAEIGAWST